MALATGSLAVRRRTDAPIKRRGYQLPAERQEFPLATEAERNRWLWCMRQAVENKAATMIAGTFPSNLAAPPSPASTRDPLERLCGAVEKLMERLAIKATA